MIRTWSASERCETGALLAFMQRKSRCIAAYLSHVHACFAKVKLQVCVTTLLKARHLAGEHSGHANRDATEFMLNVRATLDTMGKVWSTKSIMKTK